MGRPRKKREPLPPIWRVPDELWAIAEPIIAELDPPNLVAPKRVPARPILDAIIYRGRTGCQWKHLPEKYPDDSTVHRTFQRWKQAGVFERLWAELIERCGISPGLTGRGRRRTGRWAGPEQTSSVNPFGKENRRSA